MKDDIAKELLEPLAGEYASTDADRERVRAKLRDRVGGAVFVGTTSTGTSWLAGRRLLGAVVGAAGIAAVAALGAALSSRSSTEAGTPASSVDVSITPAPTVTSAPMRDPTPEQATAQTISVGALPSVVAEANVAPPSRRVAPRPRDDADGDDDLVRETRLMAKANEVMRSGDLGGALALFDQHAREFPRGVLADERVVSRIVILCRLDRRDEATREGRAFLQSHPPSPLTRRIESSCAGSGEGGDGRAP